MLTGEGKRFQRNKATKGDRMFLKPHLCVCCLCSVVFNQIISNGLTEE
jgi:hypothetical protein